MRKAFLLIAGIMFCFCLSAQSELSFQGGRFMYGDLRIHPSAVRVVMANNSEALELYESGRSLAVVGQIIAYPSAFLLGWDTGARLGGGEGNNGILIGSAVGTVVGLGFVFWGESIIRSSFSLFNSTNSELAYQVNFGITQSGGIGFTLSF